MSNKIVIEFCEADRARLDNIAVLVGTLVDRLPARINISEPDPLTKKIAAVVANAKEQKSEKPAEEGAGTAQGDEKPEALTSTHPEEEKPTAAKNEPTEAEIASARALLRSKFIELSAANKKEEAKAIVLEYAGSIPAVPADKLTECYERLCALEG